jgi:iron(III) transport system substrate-binding protein
MSKLKFIYLTFLLMNLSFCTQKNKKKPIWIYTSLYKEVLPLFTPILEKKFPDLEIKWYQAGSEDISAKIIAEQKAGKSQASLLITSDTFFYLELDEAGKLAKIESSELQKYDPHFLNPNNNVLIIRMPVMLIAFNTKFIQLNKAPTSFAELFDKKFKGMVTMPSPLQSGTALTSLFFLESKLGSDLLSKIKNSDVLVSGGNGSTFSRILSGEKPMGLVLMENILQAHSKQQSDVIYQIPKEGAIPIPSPIAQLKDCPYPQESKQVLEWFLTEEAQKIITQAWLYATLPTVEAPSGAPAWNSLHKMDWSWNQLKEWKQNRDAFKQRFQNTVLQ